MTEEELYAHGMALLGLAGTDPLSPIEWMALATENMEHALRNMPEQDAMAMRVVLGSIQGTKSEYRIAPLAMVLSALSKGGRMDAIAVILPSLADFVMWVVYAAHEADRQQLESN